MQATTSDEEIRIPLLASKVNAQILRLKQLSGLPFRCIRMNQCRKVLSLADFSPVNWQSDFSVHQTRQRVPQSIDPIAVVQPARLAKSFKIRAWETSDAVLPDRLVLVNYLHVSLATQAVPTILVEVAASQVTRV